MEDRPENDRNHQAVEQFGADHSLLSHHRDLSQSCDADLKKCAGRSFQHMRPVRHVFSNASVIWRMDFQFVRFHWIIFDITFCIGEWFGMTFDQLSIFVAVAEREHLTRAASALHLTPSAVSASIKALEGFYSVTLFDRVGRGIQLTREGRILLQEAKETLARVKMTAAVLSELGGLKTGDLDIHASQTIANYWLPPLLLKFSQTCPGIAVNLTIENTSRVAAAVIAGDAELGFIEGSLDEPALAAATIAEDRLVLVAGRANVHAIDRANLGKQCWIMREAGSGTRSVLEEALREIGISADALSTTLVLPSNEAVLSAVRSGGCVTALSETIVTPFIENGQLRAVDVELPPRRFTLLRHRERHRTAPAREFEAFCRAHH